MNSLQILNRNILRPYGMCPLVAIVGNAGIRPEDEEPLKRADCVVRFNNYATRAGIIKTSNPFRCDILFSTFDLHSNGAKPKDVVIGIPYPFKAKEIYTKPARWYPDSRHWMVNPYHNMMLCEELGLNSLGHTHPLPSIGFTALWHLQNYPADFYVTGFNWYNEGNKFQGWDLKNTNYPKTWNHNYCKEVQWTIKNLFHKNNFIFSKECARILNLAKKLS